MMHWTSDAAGRTSSCTKDSYQAVVWRTSTGEWGALLSHHHRTMAHVQCLTLQEAQQWCEARLAALAKADRHADP